MLERQREGVAKAKAEGKYKGRAPIARAKAPEVRQLHKDGVGAIEIARRLQISRASVYRVLGLTPLASLAARSSSLLRKRLHTDTARRSAKRCLCLLSKSKANLVCH